MIPRTSDFPLLRQQKLKMCTSFELVHTPLLIKNVVVVQIFDIQIFYLTLPWESYLNKLLINYEVKIDHKIAFLKSKQIFVIFMGTAWCHSLRRHYSTNVVHAGTQQYFNTLSVKLDKVSCFNFIHFLFINT